MYTSKRRRNHGRPRFFRQAVMALAVAISAPGCDPVTPPQTPANKSAASARPDPLDLILQAAHVPPAPTGADVSEVLERARPSVLLVLNRHPDKTVTFGSAILLQGNLALTNRHVIEKSESVSVMFYSPARASHGGIASEGGGLRRYVFENERELVGAEIVREDTALDLAVLRIKGDTSPYPRLPWRSDAVRVGERIYAIGHPAENTWTSTAGVVSNAHDMSIQIDATLNPGNSGGPLIDDRGRIVGINTLVASGGNQGIGYARPIALARHLVDGSSQPVALDLSTPEKAWTSCWRAAELASDVQMKCLDLANLAAVNDVAFERALTLLSNRTWRDLMHRVRVPFREAMLTWQRRAGAALIRRDVAELTAASKDFRQTIAPLKLLEKVRSLPKAELVVVQASVDAAQRRSAESRKPFRADLEEIGMKVELERSAPGEDPLVAALRRGGRIDKVHLIDAGHAWLACAGVNDDGTVYRYATLMVQNQNQWHYVPLPSAKDIASKPQGFPPSGIDFDTQATRLVDSYFFIWRGLIAAALKDK